MSYTLQTPLPLVHGIGQTWSSRLAKKNILTVGDLLLVSPLRYEDRSTTVTITQLKQLSVESPPLLSTEKTSSHPKPPIFTIQATVKSVSTFRRGPRTIQQATLIDTTGQLKAIWFNSPFVMTTLREREEYLFAGKFQAQYQSLTQPTIERISNSEAIHTGRLVPLYTSTLGLSPGMLRRILKTILDSIELPVDYVSQVPTNQVPTQAQSIESELSNNLTQTKLKSLATSLHDLHFPTSANSIIAARERLAVEELLAFRSLATTLQDQRLSSTTAPDSLDQVPPLIDVQNKFPLPFTLTPSQQASILEILTDLTQPHPMNRLLLGEVGSGKTVVAGLAAATLVSQGQSVCFLAPTRILAQQHAQTLQTLFPNLPITLLTSQTAANRSTATIKSAKSTKVEPILSDQPPINQSSNPPNSQPTTNLIIGTHALFTQIATFKPTMVIIDEQQRFGVKQRSEQLSWTGKRKATITPHTLTMTATPIPRSLVLTIFRHLQVSTLTEVPFPRQVKTWLVPRTREKKAIHWLTQELQKPASLLIVICPLVDPNSKAAENASAALQIYQDMHRHFPKFQIGLLHGQQPKKQQAEVLEQLNNNQLHVLVATSLIEVGIDLPQATHLWIENADRFGLSSLHQLRGRVGRRGQTGYCLLFSDTNKEEAQERLQFFSVTTDGFALAEADLKRRGAGEVFGTLQSGWSGLKFASWTNTKLLDLTDKLANQLPPQWQSPLQQELLGDAVGSLTN